jgi:iron complex outermembrane receptor protein
MKTWNVVLALVFAAGGTGVAVAQNTSTSQSSDSLDSLLGPSAQSPSPSTSPAPAATEAPPSQPSSGTAAIQPNTRGSDSGTAPTPADAEAKPGNPASDAAETTATVPVAKATGGTDSNRPARNRLIEEIIVTAQKRDENIKEVPISISAFNADYLGAKGVIAQQDLPKITPGLTFSAPVGFATAYIRGIGSDAFILADPLVVTYIDGVYFPASTTQFQDFGTVQKVEVDKGPQGTLFGRNALGGVIAITTTDPSLTAFQATANSTYNDFTGTRPGARSWNSSVYVSVPLPGHLALSISGLDDWNNPAYNDQVGPANNRGLIASGRGYAERVKLLYEPTEDIKLRLNYYHFYTRDAERNFAVNTAPSLLAIAAGVQPQDPFKGGTIDAIPQSGDRGITYFGSLDVHTRFVNTQLLASYEKIKATRNFDFDSSPVPLAYFEALDDGGYKKPFFSNDRSLELRLLSNDDLPEWVQFVAGVYYFEQASGIGGANFTAAGTDLSMGQVAGLTVPGLANIYSGLSALLPAGTVIPQGVDLGLRGALNDKNIAGYTQVTFKPADWTSLTLGGRYTDDKKCILYADQLLYLNADSQIPLFHYDNCGKPDGAVVMDDTHDPQYRTETKSFDPKISLNFRPGEGWLGDDPLLYLSYQQASIGNTFNTISLINAPTLAKASKISAYETGIKTYLLDHTLSLDAAAFYYKEKEPQTQVVSLQSGGAVHFENAGGLRTEGAELSLLSQILPSLTANGLVLTMGICYLDSKYTSYTDASGFDATTGIYSQTNNFTGKDVVQTPRISGTAGLNQTFQIPKGQLEFGIDYYYNSGFYFYAQNTPNTRVAPYETLGFTVSYLYQPLNVRLTGFGRNILNEHYLVARFLNDFGTDDFAAPQASYGFTLHWDYGS